MTRARVGRLIVMPLLILLVAWGVSFTTRQRDAHRIATLERAVGAWCQAAARGEDYPLVPVAAPIEPARVTEALRSACRAGDRATAWSIVIDEGPGAAPSGGSATHHAMVRVDGVDDVGLLLRCDDDQPLVVGYWLAR